MKTKADIAVEADFYGISLDYEPKVLIPNIFACGQKEWEESMKNGIGSSGAYAAIGKSPYKTSEEVAIEKITGKVKPFANDPETNYRLNSGHMQETAILKWYAENLGYEVALCDYQNPATSEIKDISEITEEEWNTRFKGKGVVCVDHARYCHPDYPFIFSDMDGLVIKPDGERYVAECKTADARDFKWKWHAGVWGQENVSVGNIGYITQARQHMLVSNTNRCDIIATCSFNALDNVIVTVERDIAEEVELIKAESDFWARVQKGEISRFTSLSERSYENVSYLLASDEPSNEPLELPATVKDTIMELVNLEGDITDLEALIKEKEERINALKVDLQIVMGSHNVGTLPSKDGYEYRCEFKSRTTTTFDRKKFDLENPGLTTPYLTSKTSDPKLSVKEVKIKTK